MYAIPQLIAVPALSNVAMTTIEWPALGAFLAWMLIAALVGIGLGALRRMTSPPPGMVTPRTLRPHTVAGCVHPHADADHGHLEAA